MNLSSSERAETVIVLAKEPQPGRVKTRLQTRFSPEEAAELAGASLLDTMTAVRGSAVPRRVLAWQGDPARWRADFEVVAQPDGTLNDRLTAAFADAWPTESGPAPHRALLVGMDTPQVTPAELNVDWDGADALLGLSEDGGFWAIGLRAGHPPGIFDGVPMSSDRTGSAQLARLSALGLSVRLLPPLRDVDTPADAEAVAERHPGLEFSRLHARLVGRRAEQRCDQLFDQAYAGGLSVLSGTVADAGDEHTLVMEVDRWTADADPVDLMVVARCQPPVIDLGCGPGRMVRALARSGRVALGVDMSQVAVNTSLARGGPALRRMIDEPMPAEGRWGTALLMDSNLGIGGDVEGLLRRCRDLVGPGGLIICEVDPDQERHEVHQVLLRTSRATSPPMPWSCVGAAALARIAATLDLLVHEEWVSGNRAFVALRSSGPR
ncbi:MAG TPA: DUF2064 domain-containing protein [Propionibacteriaceae bacterium]